jgi:hypothetical protein
MKPETLSYIYEMGMLQFFGSSALQLWNYFMHLEDLEIDTCDVLAHWPEKDVPQLNNGL